METGTLAPPMFPREVPVTSALISRGGTVRPFGLTKALPVSRSPIEDEEWAQGLSLCPERQITVTQDGEPFIDATSMKTHTITTSTTVEDMQRFTDRENDTDK